MYGLVDASEPNPELPPSTIDEVGDYSDLTALEGTAPEIKDLSNLSEVENEVTLSGMRRILSGNKFLSAAWDEMGDAPIADKALMTASLIGMAFNYGPGNEWLLTQAGTETMQRLAEYGNILLTAGVTGLVLSATSMAYHSLTGLLMARNLKRFPRSVSVLQESRTADSAALDNSENRTLAGKFWNAFSIGSDSVVLEDSITDSEFVNEGKGKARAIGSAALIAAGTFALGATAGAIVQQAVNSGNYELADQFLDVVSDTRLWVGGFIAYRLAAYGIKKAKRAAAARELSTEDTTEYIPSD